MPLVSVAQSSTPPQSWVESFEVTQQIFAEDLESEPQCQVFNPAGGASFAKLFIVHQEGQYDTYRLDGVEIPDGSWVGVFYQTETERYCCGYTQYLVDETTFMDIYAPVCAAWAQEHGYEKPGFYDPIAGEPSDQLIHLGISYYFDGREYIVSEGVQYILPSLQDFAPTEMNGKYYPSSFYMYSTLDAHNVTVSGVVYDYEENTVENVKVVATSESEDFYSDVTVADGKYSITLPYHFTGDLEVQYVGSDDNCIDFSYSFPIAAIEEDLEKDIVLERSLVELTGTVLDKNGDPIQTSVIMTFTNGETITVQSNATGAFVFEDVLCGEYVQVTTELTTRPAFHNVTVEKQDTKAGLVFIVCNNTYKVSGNVELMGSGLSNVLLQLTEGGTLYDYVLTDVNGDYSFNVPEDFSGILEPTTEGLCPACLLFGEDAVEGYTFTPASYDLTTLSADVVCDFVADYVVSTISGVVTDELGNPLENVTIRVYEGSNHVEDVKTDVNGYYEVEDIHNAYEGRIIPQLAGHYFEPYSFVVENIDTDTTVDFVAKAQQLPVEWAESLQNHGALMQNIVGVYTYPYDTENYRFVPTLNGAVLNEGDWIGAFYTDELGELKCAGATQWFEAEPSIMMTVYGADAYGEGFADGEDITFAVYSNAVGETFFAKDASFYSAAETMFGSEIYWENLTFKANTLSEFKDLVFEETIKLDIFGVIVDDTDAPIANVNIFNVYTNEWLAKTDANGEYIVNDILLYAESPAMTIAPSLEGYTFTPINFTTDDMPTYHAEANFVGTSVSTPWVVDPTHGVGAHIMMIPDSVVLLYEGAPLPYGSYIGAFYLDENGDLECGGYTCWDGFEKTIVLYEDEAMTVGIKEGFHVGESIEWRVYTFHDNQESQTHVVYAEGELRGVPLLGGNFTINGLSLIEAMIYLESIEGLRIENELAEVVSGTTVESCENVYDLFAVVDDLVNEPYFSYKWQIRGEGANEWYSVYGADSAHYLAAYNNVDPTSDYRVIVYVSGLPGVADTAAVDFEWNNYNLNVVIEGEQSICEGTDFELLTSVVDNVCTYQWMLNGAAIDGATADTYMPTEAGEYSLTVYNPCGTPFVSNVVVVEFTPQPVVFAGDDFYACDRSTHYTLLDATAENCESIAWEIVSGEGALSSTTELNPIFYPSSLYYIGEVQIKLTGYPFEPCTQPVEDIITITFEPTPNLDAQIVSDVVAGLSCDVDTNSFVLEGVGEDLSRFDFLWQVIPASAGQIEGENVTADVAWDPDFSGNVQVMVTVTYCGGRQYEYVTDLARSITPVLDVVQGPEYVSPAEVASRYYVDVEPTAETYTWEIVPAEAGVLNADANSVWVTWNSEWQGNVVIQVTADGVCGTSETIELWVFRSLSYAPQGMEDSVISMNIYPNPTNGNFSLAAINVDGEYQVEIINYTGQVVYAETYSANKVNISMNSVAPGMYFVRLTNNGSTIVQRMIVR